MTIWKRRRNDDLEQARAARARAEQELAQTRAETPHFRALAVQLKELRKKNHFAEAIKESFRGGNA